MTPDWIYSNFTKPATFSVYPEYYEILPGGVAHQQTLQFQLVPPGTLSSTDSITVSITIAMDTVVAEQDHDPRFGISDGKSFIGFFMTDKGNWDITSPCHGIEADIVNKILSNVKRGIGHLVSSQKYSSEIRLQIRPRERWGSCHTEHDEGYTNTAKYQHHLDLSQGLYLEMYRADAGEKYRIKYIKVGIELD